MKLFRSRSTIEDGSWVGARAILCPGVSIGAGSIVAAGSVVIRAFRSLRLGGEPRRFRARRRRLGPRIGKLTAVN